MPSANSSYIRDGEAEGAPRQKIEKGRERHGRAHGQGGSKSRCVVVADEVVVGVRGHVLPNRCRKRRPRNRRLVCSMLLRLPGAPPEIITNPKRPWKGKMKVI